jgi:linalool 8-monooxygenase
MDLVTGQGTIDHGGKIDLKNPDLYVDAVPYETFAWLRANDPVHWNPEADGPGFWALTRHEHIVQVSTDPETFSSARANGGHRIFNEDDAADPSVEASMISMDPPRHVDYRRMIMGGFTPPRLRDMEAGIRARAHALINAMITKQAEAGGPIDFVDSFSAPYAIQTLAELFGVGPEDGDKLFEWSNAVVGEDDPELRSSQDYINACIQEMAIYSMGLWQLREQALGDDLISMLVRSAKDGAEMPVQRYLATFILLVVAGNETTRNSITGGMIALVQNPDQRAALITDPSLLPHAAHEIVRYVSPVMHMRRTATRDVELGGKTIKAGDKVVMWYGSGNRDEAVFDAPNQFDIRRTVPKDSAPSAPGRHLGFGFGQHVCLGQRLAELQLKVAFETLFERLPNLKPVGAPRRLRSNFINGIKCQMVTF